MSLELANTTASLVTVTIVAVTALAALIQLRLLKGSGVTRFTILGR